MGAGLYDEDLVGASRSWLVKIAGIYYELMLLATTDGQAGRISALQQALEAQRYLFAQGRHAHHTYWTSAALGITQHVFGNGRWDLSDRERRLIRAIREQTSA